jgi:hypothetical protein
MAVIMALPVQEPPASASLGPQARPRPPQPLADPESPNPAPSRPDLAAGIFPIPIGPGSGKYSGFQVSPEPDLAGISGNRGT